MEPEWLVDMEVDNRHPGSMRFHQVKCYNNESTQYKKTEIDVERSVSKYQRYAG